MSDKICFWLDAEPTSFCIAYYLKKIYDADFFAVIDITDRPKHFFKNQKLVEFKKIWFYHDHIKTTENADLKYLENFQKKYGIDF